MSDLRLVPIDEDSRRTIIVLRDEHVAKGTPAYAALTRVLLAYEDSPSLPARLAAAFDQQVPGQASMEVAA